MTSCLIMLMMGAVRTRLRGKKIILGKRTRELYVLFQINLQFRQEKSG